MLQQFTKWRTEPVISDAYTRPIYVCLAQQLGIGLFCSLLLDGGYTAYLCGTAVALSWALNAVILFCRPQHPTQADLKLIRWNFVPFFFFVAVVNLILKR